MTRRRRFVWLAAILVVAALVVPAVAVAAPDSTMSGTQGTNSALTWTNVRDSDGVPLSSYKFVTSEPEIWKPLQTILAFVLQVMFMVWLVIVTLAIWIIGFALSFGWLDYLAEILLGAANLFAGQVATSIVLLAAATVGAFFVAYFIARGFYAKATVQVVTMLVVAVFGVLFLAHPLAEVLGPDGLLAKGRDVGISIAAGLNGNSNPDPANVVATMQASLADNFVRKPLQVWNFGHVIDDQCGAAWSSGMMSGDSSQVRASLGGCDRDAFWAASEPSFNQLGAGLLLFVCGVILVWFAIRLGFKLIQTAMNAVYHGFMSILGFAAGGFIYGPTQTFLIRNLVDTAFAAFGMAAYTVFLGVYVLVLGDVFQQAGRQVVPVFVVGAIVMLVATRQMLNLRASLESGGQWVANRFAMATQASGGGGRAGSGAGSGGAALGMGDGSSTMRDWGPIPTLWALNTLAAAGSNPLLLPLWSGSNHPLRWQLRWQQSMNQQRAGYDAMVQKRLHRRKWVPGQEVEPRILAGIVDDWRNNGLPMNHLFSSLASVANVEPSRVDAYLSAFSNIDRNVPSGADPVVGKAFTGAFLYRSRFYDPSADEDGKRRAFEALGVAARNYQYRAYQDAGAPITATDANIISRVTRNADSQAKLFDEMYDPTTNQGDWGRLSVGGRFKLQQWVSQGLRDAHHAHRDANYSEATLDDLSMWARRAETIHSAFKASDKKVSPLG